MLPVLLGLFLTATPTGIMPAQVSTGAGVAATVCAALEAQTGIRVEGVDGTKPVPAGKGTFWEAIDRVCTATSSRVSAVGPGRTVKLAPGRDAHANDGAFRVTAKAVVAKYDAEADRTTYTLHLEVAWEPRFPVFRIDAQPQISAGRDDLGNVLSGTRARVKTPPTGASFVAQVLLVGLSRKSATIASVSGSFTVTASPKMLAFAFDSPTALPAAKSLDGVTLKLARIEKDEDRWEVDVTAAYPAGQPEFESFESWASGNTLTLVAPGGKTHAPANFQIDERTGRLAGTYRFKGIDLSNRTGWRAVYETPAPMAEFPVAFTLTGIPLP